MTAFAACQRSPAPNLSGILVDTVQTTTFEQVTQSVAGLYAAHPEIVSYQNSQGLTYTVATRDKVLKVCHDGGFVEAESQRESQRLLGCAPLILYFYEYGKERGVVASTDVARYIYWYARGSSSNAKGQVLTNLLKSWGIE